jgi:hypothetical protein
MTWGRLAVVLRGLIQLTRLVVGGALVRVGSAIVGDLPQQEADQHDPDPMMPPGHPVVTIGPESAAMLAEGLAPPPKRKVEPPTPLRGSIAARVAGERRRT